MFFLVFFLFLVNSEISFGVQAQTPCPCKVTQAVAVLSVKTPEGQDISGNVVVHQDYRAGKVTVTVNMKGVKPGSKHGLHVHEFGNLGLDCTTAGPHFNPFKENHAFPTDIVRHVGDIALNVVGRVDDGTFQETIQFFTAKDFRSPTLCGANSIVGRALVLHAMADDGGRGNATDSKTTGNSGKRIACGVFGVQAEM